RADQPDRRPPLRLDRPSRAHLRARSMSTEEQGLPATVVETQRPSRAAAPGLVARTFDSDLWFSFRSSRLVILAAAITILMVGAALLAPVIAPHDPYDLRALNLMDSDLPPAWTAGGDRRFLLGTD